MSNEKNGDVNQQVSFAKIITKEDFLQNSFMPPHITDNLGEKSQSKPYFLWIYVPGDDKIKATIYPYDNPSISKFLIQLSEFSPNLVTGISKVLIKYNLNKEIVHTSGLCFSEQNCFYESYVKSTNDLPVNKIMDEFLKLDNVVDVKILKINV